MQTQSTTVLTPLAEAYVSPVMEIKSEEFTSQIADAPKYVSKLSDPIVIEFFQPECETCEAIEDVWAEIALDTTDVIIANYNCMADEASKMTCAGLHLKATPTIIYLAPGKSAKHGGPPEFDFAGMQGTFTAVKFREWLDTVHPANNGDITGEQ